MEKIDKNVSEIHSAEGIEIKAQYFHAKGLLNNAPILWRIEKDIDLSTLSQAINQVINRHQILGRSYHYEGDTFIFTNEGRRELEIIDRRSESHDFQSLALLFKQRSFQSWENKPLIVASIFKVDGGSDILVLEKPLFVSDSYSDRLIVDEIESLYSGISPESPKKEFADFIQWQNELAESEKGERIIQYWTNASNGIESLNEIGIGSRSPNPSNTVSINLQFEVSKTETNDIKSLCSKNGLSTESFLMTLVYFLIHKIKKVENISISRHFIDRPQSIANLVGYCENYIPIIKRMSPDLTFKELWEELDRDCLMAFKNKWFPVEALLNKLGQDQRFNLDFINSVGFTYQDESTRYNLGENESIIQIQDLIVFNQSQPLYTKFIDCEEKIEVGISYNLNQNDYFSIDLEKSFNLLINEVLNNLDLSLNEIKLTNADIEKELLDVYDQNNIEFDSLTLQEIFEQRVKASPNKIAVVSESHQLTFDCINQQANKLAHYLIDNYNAASNQIFGIVADRSEWMIISILGVLKSGAAYLPIEPDLPELRFNYLIQNSGIDTIITDLSEVIFDNQDLNWINLDTDWKDVESSISNPPLRSQKDDLAYVIYTSGSTGNPKGVMVNQLGLLNRIKWMWDYMKFDHQDVILFKTPYIFDVSVWEIFMPLLFGAKMIVCKKEVAQEPLRLTAYIKDHKATTIHFVPSMLNAFQAFFDDILTERLASLKRIICSGEELMKEMVQKHYQYLKCPLYNLYGPTEASIDVSCYETKPDDDLIYIGKPISNTRIVILDDQMKLLPTGFQGEICLSGIGLAIGYLNNDELTNEKFPLAPFLENERIYKTGDYGRIDHNGNIVYVGRIDSQIKLRGYRIELGEIENQLLTFEPVLNTAVLCDHDREILIAFIQSAHKVEPYEIESYLTERLPSYMVPSKSIVLTDFPSTASGKIDKKVLREIYLRELNKKNDHEGRLTAVERELRNIWCDALVIDNVGIDDNFFGIGGHSLNAAKLIARVIEIFNIKLELRSIFDSPTIRELAKHIEDRLEISDSLISSNSLYGVEKIEEQDYYEVSHGQWRLWVLDKIEGSQYAYIISNAYSIEHLKLPEFEAAFNDLIKRHEILRTKFVYMDGHLKQKVVERDAININKHDLREEKEKETSINNFAKGEQRIPFDLENEVPIRCTLLQIEDDKYVFILTVHHILVDGWSLQVMVNEVITNYNNRVTNVQTRLPDLTYQYKDYSAWQLDQLNNEQGELHKAYWHNIFSHDLPDLNFPTDFQRPPIQTFNGKRVYKEIDQSIVNDLYSLNSSTNSSLFMTILASLKVLLFKYTGQNDIVVGSPVAGRELIHFQDQIGFYVNTLAIRTELSNNDTFHTFLETVKHNVLEAYEHQIYPYDRLVTELGLNRDMSRTPLYDIALIVQSEETNEQNELIDCKIESLLNEHETSMNDIRILFTESPDRLLISVDYNTDLYADSTIDLLLENYVTLLDNLLHFSDIPLTDVPCISASQNERLYGKLGLDNNVELEEKSIVNLFKEQVHKTPNQPALIFNDESWTYEELDHHSSRLASHLINKFDIKRGEIIGLLVDRSEHMIIAILAILKSGGAYLPIDPNYPDERIQFMLDDSNTRLILTESEYMFEIANLSADVEAFILDLQYDHIDSEITNLDFNIDPTDLAYIIYTSGSTGKPKGVLIEHRGSVNMVLAQAGTFNISQDDRILQFASISFDASVFEILMALLNGGGLVLIESDIINDPVQMIDYCKEKEVSVVTLPPSYLSNLDINKLDFLRIIITAGESAIKRDVERSIEHCQYFNAYGPSEYSVWATYYEASGDEPYSSVPIGIPINNTQVFVVDKQERLTPIGAVGEICLSGPGVARGYLNRPEETAKNFVKSAFDTKTWMYKTGDLGKWLPDGNLEFIGRRDNQIKLRGYRIELNEISQTILTIEGVKDVHVALRGNEKDKQLVAYVVKQEDAGEINIREGLENTLPHYLIPSMFIELEELPLTLNGKIDSEKLSSYDKSHLTNRGDLVEPADSYETKILEIWIEVIGIEKISVLDNFFEVGGDSLKVMKLYSLLNNAYPDVIKVTDLFVHKNIRETADVLRNNQPDQDSGKVGGLKRMTI